MKEEAVQQLRSRKPGFTLIELLVVISIIAVVISITLPSLRDAREQSKQLVCRQNLTGQWRGILMYSTDNRDRAPFIEKIGTTIDPFDAQYPTSVGNVLGPFIERRHFICPSAVSGYPDSTPGSRWKWKITYDYSAADKDRAAVPYDSAPGAYSRTQLDPAVANEYHWDGRPLWMITVSRPVESREPGDASGGGSGKATIIWTVSPPLIADKLGEASPGDIAGGRPIYPHRGLVRRQSDVFRSLMTSENPLSVSSRRPGYFHLHAQNERAAIFLTRHTPDAEPVPH